MLPLLTIILPSDATESSVGVGDGGKALFPEENSDPDMTVVSGTATTSAPNGGGDVSYSDFGENQGCNSIDIFLSPESVPEPVPSRVWSFETLESLEDKAALQ